MSFGFARVVSVLLFITQIYLTFFGINHLGQIINPFVLLLSYVLLLLVFFSIVSKTSLVIEQKSATQHFTLTFFGILVFASSFPLFQQAFHSVPKPVEVSDVIPQLTIQFERFIKGENPYQQVNLPHSQPFPVYMPFHWLPVGIAKLFSIDVRSSGLILMLFSVGYFSFQMKSKSWSNNLVQLLPVLPFLVYLKCGKNDLLVSLESIIAAYYLFLAVALVSRNKTAITIGIVLCLLSRYTIVFWMPFFLFVFFPENGWKSSMKFLMVIFAVLMCIYVLPFLWHHPYIIIDGLNYHNDAVSFEWKYTRSTFNGGFYLAPFFELILSGDIVDKVAKVRMIQASVMILLFVVGIFLYRKKRNKIHHYDLCLGMLYLTIICFYIFSPLTYRYYLITPMMLSAVLCLRVFIGIQKNPAHEEQDFESISTS